MIMEQREIERKFLVTGDGWKKEATGVTMAIQHVYVANTPDVGMRTGTFTLYPSDDSEPLRRGGVTIKIPRDGLVRNEIELDLDCMIGEELFRYLDGKLPTIQKIRHYVKIDDNLEWEIDCFTTVGLQDLVIAEVELPFEDYPDFVTPDWIGEEVTNDHQYYNAVMAETHFVKRPNKISEEIDKNFMDNWSFLIKGDGTVNLELLKYELSDFSHLINEVPKIYSHIAGLSKHMYYADTIIGEADRRYWEHHREIMLDDIEGMDDIQEVIEYLKTS